ncbi:uncharacterized protein LOC133837495 isoform X1 [Drosophila sulfurigaster albostrigata]|uniref:uncharacterized protein LOC133837495 isoform X1 n=1 Tax=Drosophila sulfurigaster albostrigata TaxID=89887 RepID=UPI002D218EB3|nr:uncharacterized protein LOC133837495 isoform X1 [Drosophila sulfurigaster albostrigata]XP_062124259.1 uncharacterized protein LOC133837495 isoform X1 [Drosophila sulfurigaster albostrigata]
MDNQATADQTSTSEVGFGPEQSTARDVFALLEQQNRNFLALLKGLQTPASEVQPSSEICLPKYNPDIAGVDATQWAATVDIILRTKPLSDSALILVLSKALEGSSAQWLSQICYPGITWPQFRQLFEQRYETSETPAAVISNLLSSRPSNGESLPVYASRCVTSLCTKLRNLSSEQIAIALVLGHMGNFDRRLQRTLHTTHITSRRELQAELQAFSALRERPVMSNGEPEAKRARTMEIKCYQCGKPGHKKQDCKSGKSTQAPATAREWRAGQPRLGRANVICYRCQEPGHIATNCPNKKQSTGSGTKSEKRVELCAVGEPQSSMLVNGEKFPITFDSGAECSLVKESISNKIVGKRIHNVISLKGIGNANICSTVQIESNIMIDGNSLVVLFHVVPDECMKNNIVIGREILAQGFLVEVAYDNFKIVQSKVVNICETYQPTNFDAIETEMLGKEKEILI